MIRPAVTIYGYEPIRADHIAKPGLITFQIIEHLTEDELVIADLTGRNPNVYYELAIRHYSNKPYIQIKETTETLPFDIENMRTIDVDYRFVKSMEKCKQYIMKQIEAMEKENFVVQSPITFVSSIKSIGKDDAQAKINLEILSQIQNLKSELDNVKRSLAQYISRPSIEAGHLFPSDNANSPTSIGQIKLGTFTAFPELTKNNNDYFTFAKKKEQPK